MGIRTIAYIATSLDGYIAGPEDDVSWLDPFNTEDYGFVDFLKTIGTAVMGSRTYEQALIHPERILTGVEKTYVITSRVFPLQTDDTVETWSGPLPDLVRKIGSESGKDVYIVGGGITVSRFLDEGLLDEIRQFVVPLVLAAGIPLYTGIRKRIPLLLTGTRSFKTGLVELRYEPANRRSLT